MKFKRIYGRTTSREFPLSLGTNSVKFIEDPNGKTLTDWATEMIASTDEKIIQLLNLELIMYVEIFSTAAAEDRMDIAQGIKIITDKSISYRQTLTGADVNEHSGRVALLKEEARRPYTCITTHVPQDIKTFENFYTVNYDYDEDVLKNMELDIMKSFRWEGIYSIVVSGKYLKENKDSTMTEMLNGKARLLKNVYADSPEYLDDLYVCIKSLE